jgi:uncharacterized protein YciI
MLLAVLRRRGPAWDRTQSLREQDAWDEHAAFMDALVDDGIVVLGGPLGDGEETLLIFDAADDDEVRERLARDPWTAMGLLELERVQRWQLLLGELAPSL